MPRIALRRYGFVFGLLFALAALTACDETNEERIGDLEDEVEELEERIEALEQRMEQLGAR